MTASAPQGGRALAERDEPTNELTPMTMLDRAVSAGASVETLAQLMALQERWEANQARQAFVQARAAAKATLATTPIVKNRTGHNERRYADFSAYANVIDPILANHGLSYGFETEHTDRIKVTCVLQHDAGYEVRNSLSGPPDQTGNKNAIQAIGSTVTYLQRYTLTAALGLSASDDDDGKAAGMGETISEDQVKTLQAAIMEVDADLPKFLQYMKVEKLEDLPLAKYADAIAALNAKRKGAKA